ncbi:hypothetical protein GCM10018781_20560 [Kitasatospora indigofera]|uniref:Uncharacterized protein n=1 Tax=Kitasatospora indigofera TaxID=67307 RepID=A0A919FJI0_9ACTN|nr:hypothetical protein GCM10018781_20560 [Kitasatospora indigofera]
MRPDRGTGRDRLVGRAGVDWAGGCVVLTGVPFTADVYANMKLALSLDRRRRASQVVVTA